ncbi:MAG TPA: hypothetical protein VIJ53_00160 [Acidobacteriaceae bacterium]
MAIKAQTLRVKIIDGKTGKPVAHEHVDFFKNGNFADMQGVVPGFVTDEDGVITTSDIAADTQTFGVSVDWHRACSKHYQWFSLHQIFSNGLVGENSCKPKIKQETAPGTLIFYVRPETFFEKMAH